MSRTQDASEYGPAWTWHIHQCPPALGPLKQWQSTKGHVTLQTLAITSVPPVQSQIGNQSRELRAKGLAFHQRQNAYLSPQSLELRHFQTSATDRLMLRKLISDELK